MCAQRNMLEGPVLFAALLLVAQLLGKGNDMIVYGAQVFFWALVAYAGIYIAGLPRVRTGVLAVSVIGLLMIFLQPV